MATKKEELENPDSTWNKTGDDEQVFVLRSNDASMYGTILHWLMNNQHIGYEKHESAINTAYSARKQMRKAAD